MEDVAEVVEVPREEPKPRKRKRKYRFLTGVNYRPLDEKRYEAGEEDALEDWEPEHVENALRNEFIRRA